MSSLLLVANRIDATKTAMMTGTTTNGEEMCIAQAPCWFQSTKWIGGGSKQALLVKEGGFGVIWGSVWREMRKIWSIFGMFLGITIA